MPASMYTKELADEICERLSQGETLADICRDERMPAVRTVSDWRATHSDFEVAYCAARDVGFDAIAADCLRIADTPMPGTIEKRELLGVVKRSGEDGKEQSIVLPDAELVVTEERVEDMLGHRRLQIDTRLKLLAKWDPRRYGDRVQMEHTGSIRQMSDEELDARLQKLLAGEQGEGS